MDGRGKESGLIPGPNDTKKRPARDYFELWWNDWASRLFQTNQVDAIPSKVPKIEGDSDSARELESVGSYRPKMGSID